LTSAAVNANRFERYGARKKTASNFAYCANNNVFNEIKSECSKSTMIVDVVIIRSIQGWPI